MNKIKAISNRFFGMILPLFLRRLRLHLTFRRIQHILNENSIPLGWICNEHVRHRADELAVLDDRRA